MWPEAIIQNVKLTQTIPPIASGLQCLKSLWTEPLRGNFFLTKWALYWFGGKFEHFLHICARMLCFLCKIYSIWIRGTHKPICLQIWCRIGKIWTKRNIALNFTIMWTSIFIIRGKHHSYTSNGHQGSSKHKYFNKNWPSFEKLANSSQSLDGHPNKPQNTTKLRLSLNICHVCFLFHKKCLQLATVGNLCSWGWMSSSCAWSRYKCYGFPTYANLCTQGSGIHIHRAAMGSKGEGWNLLDQ